jgi:hypothetical protein
VFAYLLEFVLLLQVLIAAHGNSLRALVKHLDNLRFFFFERDFVFGKGGLFPLKRVSFETFNLKTP